MVRPKGAVEDNRAHLSTARLRIPGEKRRLFYPLRKHPIRALGPGFGEEGLTSKASSCEFYPIRAVGSNRKYMAIILDLPALSL